MPSLPIPLPPGFTPVVSENAFVKEGDILARRVSQSEGSSTVSLANLLKVNAKKVPQLLKKEPGDMIREGEVIASRSRGIHTTDIVSNVTGTIVGYDRSTGELSVQLHTKQISEKDEEKTLIAPLEGVVTVCNNEQIVLTTKQDVSVGSLGIGQRVQGVLMAVQAGRNGIIDGVDLHTAMVDKILLGEQFSREALVKASSMEIAGAVTRVLPEDDVAYLTQKHIVFSILALDAETYDAFAKKTGKVVFIDPIVKKIGLIA